MTKKTLKWAQKSVYQSLQPFSIKGKMVNILSLDYQEAKLRILYDTYIIFYNVIICTVNNKYKDENK